MNVTTTTQHFVGNKSFERCNFNCSEQQQQQPDDEYLTTMYDVLRYVGWASGFQSAFCRRLSGSLLRRHVTGKNSPFIYLAAWPSAFLTLDFWPALVSYSYVVCQLCSRTRVGLRKQLPFAQSLYACGSSTLASSMLHCAHPTTFKHDIMKTNEPILMPISISGPRGTKQSTLRVRKSKIKVKRDRRIVLDPLWSSSFYT